MSCAPASSNPDERFIVMSKLHAHIQDVFNEYGVQIISPHFLTQPSQAVMVPKDQLAVPARSPST